MGVLLDEKLKFETHIEYICKKACAGIEALRRIKPFSSPLKPLQPYTIHLYNLTLIRFPPLWDTRGKQLKDKLQKN